jgi:hypothetical protein
MTVSVELILDMVNLSIRYTGQSGCNGLAICIHIEWLVSTGVKQKNRDN